MTVGLSIVYGHGVIDGRRLRREQNRSAVLDALGELYAEGNYQPNWNEIAERAGLSPRSLFRYFDDGDDLTRAAIEHNQAKARPLLDAGVSPSDPTEVKIRSLVEARLRLYDAIGPAARAARIGAPRHPLIAAQVAQTRTYLRKQLGRLFAEELAQAPHALPAADVLCSFESHELMRFDHRLSRAKTAEVLVDGLTRLLEPAR
ncbi:MAG: TetR/AcrR family transcriptional regulator [Actinomycetota bacterium]